MTDKDNMLIKKAESIYPTRWGEINPSDADTDEARVILERLRKKKYHEEEFLISHR